MKKLLMIVLITFSSALTLSPAYANPQDLGTCFLDSLTGKERKLLVEWIYFAMAAHPELTDYSNITSDNRKATDEKIGALITRLFVEDCPSEAKSAQKVDPMAIQQAFELVGQVAMQEILANQEVMKSISNYVQYADQSKINALFTD